MQFMFFASALQFDVRTSANIVDVPVHIAKLPAQLLALLNGSLAVPYLLPMISARPSPPHISDNTIMPTGESRQKTTVTAVMMST